MQGVLIMSLQSYAAGAAAFLVLSVIFSDAAADPAEENHKPVTEMQVTGEQVKIYGHCPNAFWRAVRNSEKDPHDLQRDLYRQMEILFDVTGGHYLDFRYNLYGYLPDERLGDRRERLEDKLIESLEIIAKFREAYRLDARLSDTTFAEIDPEFEIAARGLDRENIPSQFHFIWDIRIKAAEESLNNYNEFIQAERNNMKEEPLPLPDYIQASVLLMGAYAPASSTLEEARDSFNSFDTLCEEERNAGEITGALTSPAPE